MVRHRPPIPCLSKVEVDYLQTGTGLAQLVERKNLHPDRCPLGEEVALGHRHLVSRSDNVGRQRLLCVGMFYVVHRILELSHGFVFAGFVFADQRV